jgi:hypothetical protein
LVRLVGPSPSIAVDVACCCCCCDRGDTGAVTVTTTVFDNATPTVLSSLPDRGDDGADRSTVATIAFDDVIIVVATIPAAKSATVSAPLTMVCDTDDDDGLVAADGIVFVDVTSISISNATEGVAVVAAASTSSATATAASPMTGVH